ncbi:MAG: hypothetical protein MHM6MM_004188 [Cercozoa sp. M6MM]
MNKTALSTVRVHEEEQACAYTKREMETAAYAAFGGTVLSGMVLMFRSVALLHSRLRNGAGRRTRRPKTRASMPKQQLPRGRPPARVVHNMSADAIAVTRRTDAIAMTRRTDAIAMTRRTDAIAMTRRTDAGRQPDRTADTDGALTLTINCDSHSESDSDPELEPVSPVHRVAAHSPAGAPTGHLAAPSFEVHHADADRPPLTSFGTGVSRMTDS